MRDIHKGITGLHRWKCACGARCKSAYTYQADASSNLEEHRKVTGCSRKAKLFVAWMGLPNYSGFPQRDPARLKPKPATLEMIRWAEEYPGKPMPPEMLDRWRNPL